MSADDLENNPFYNLLQTTYRPRFEEAQTNCWLVCVPKATSLKGVKINSKFVDAHILKPSPFFKSQYTCADGDLQKSLEVNDSHVTSVSGFQTDMMVEILGEELCYNKSFKPYRLLTISAPLEGNPAAQCQVEKDSSVAVIEKFLSLKGCLAFLRSFPEHEPVLAQLDKKLESFRRTYMILPTYLHDTAQKLRDLTLWASEALQRCHPRGLSRADGTLQNIMLSLESHVLGAVQQKVFSAVKQFCRQEDSALVEKMKQLNLAGFSPDQLGVRDAFCCPLPKSVVELASLDSKLTPLEKLWCLKTTLKLMSDEIYDSTAYSCARLKNPHEDLHLTSDDLIPILVCLIVRCKLPHLESNLYYIQNFSWNLPDKDMMGYTLVTFQAAKEFIKSQDTSHLKPSSTNMKREITPTELMQVASQLEMLEKSSGSGSCQGPKTRPIDRQLEQVTKLIESATSEFQKREVEELQELFKHQEDNSNRGSLGNFIMGLQDSLGVTYGKLESPK